MMLRLGLSIAVVALAAPCAISQAQEDSDFAADLQAANADGSYSHIINEKDRVYVYRLHQTSALFRTCDRRYIGVLECSVKEISEIVVRRSSTSNPLKSTAHAATVQAGSNQTGAKSTSTKSKPPAPNTSEWVPFLRQNIPDISLFGQIKPPKSSTGATISYSNDRVAINETWGISGIAGLAYKFYGNYSTNSDPYILAAYFAPYVSVNRVGNSSRSQTSKNLDTISPGAKVEVGVDQLWGGQQYFRFGGAAVVDEIASTTAASATFEWIPVYGKFIHYPGTIGGIISYRFDPELIVQFDSATDAKKPLLFSGQNQALRIGPQASLYIQLIDRDIPVISKLSPT